MTATDTPGRQRTSGLWARLGRALGRLNLPSVRSLRALWFDRSLDPPNHTRTYEMLVKRHELGDTRVADLFVEVLGYKTASELHPEAAEALGAFRDPRAWELLVRILDDPRDDNTRARAAAAKVLGSFGDPRAVDPLIRALAWELEHADWDATAAADMFRNTRVAYAVIDALVSLRDPRALPVLIAVYEQQHRYVTSASLGAILRIMSGAGPSDEGGMITDTEAEQIVSEARAFVSKMGNP